MVRAHLCSVAVFAGQLIPWVLVWASAIHHGCCALVDKEAPQGRCVSSREEHHQDQQSHQYNTSTRVPAFKSIREECSTMPGQQTHDLVGTGAQFKTSPKHSTPANRRPASDQHKPGLCTTKTTKSYSLDRWAKQQPREDPWTVAKKKQG